MNLTRVIGTYRVLGTLPPPPPPIPDSDPPIVNIVQPQQGAIVMLNLNQPLTVSGNSADVGSGVDYVEVSLEGGPFVRATGTTNWTVTFNNIPQGLRTVRVRARDKAGNMSAEKARAFTVQPPVSGLPPALAALTNGYMILYYGSPLSTVDYPKIKAAKPAFVILSSPLHPASVYNQYHADGMKALQYIATNYGNTNVNAAINTAMTNGADGVHFDECQPNLWDTYYRNCWNRVKAFGTTKIVSVNPGFATPNPGIFQVTDIADVENANNVNLASYNINPRRWMSIQGDPISASPATLAQYQQKLNAFRANKGWWYYAGGPEHWRLPAYLQQSADWVKSLGY